MPPKKKKASQETKARLKRDADRLRKTIFAASGSDDDEELSAPISKRRRLSDDVTDASEPAFVQADLINTTSVDLALLRLDINAIPSSSNTAEATNDDNFPPETYVPFSPRDYSTQDFDDLFDGPQASHQHQSNSKIQAKTATFASQDFDDGFDSHYRQGTVEPEDEIANNATTFATQEFDDGFASHYHQGTSKTPVVDTNATTFATQDFDDGFDSHYRQATPDIHNEIDSDRHDGYLENFDTADIPLFEPADFTGIVFGHPVIIPHPTIQRLNFQQVNAFIAAMIPHAIGRNFLQIALLDSFYLDALTTDPTLPITSYLRVYPHDPELILCPLHFWGNHRSLLAINVTQLTANYYDTWNYEYDRNEFCPTEKERCDFLIDKLVKAGICFPDTKVVKAHRSTFNKQSYPDDCTTQVCMLAEEIAFSGHTVLQRPFNANKIFQRIKNILTAVQQQNENTDVKGTLPHWPIFVQEVAVRPPIEPELRSQNDLIQQLNAPAPDNSAQPIVQTRSSQRKRSLGSVDERVYNTKVKSLHQRGIPIALNSSDLDPLEYSLGEMDKQCKCKALLFRLENSNKCCSNGAIPAQIFSQPPPIWTRLESLSVFQLYRRQLNDLLAFATCQSEDASNYGATFLIGDQVYKSSDALTGNPILNFHQNYTADADEALNSRIDNDSHWYAVKRSHEADFKKAIHLLESMLREYHPLAKLLMHTKDVLEDERKKAETEGVPLKKFYMVWEGGSSSDTHKGCLNIPGAPGQVFNIYRSDDGGPAPRGIWFGVSTDGSNSIKYISEHNKLKDAAAFPLMFIFGEEGWTPGIRRTKNHEAIDSNPIDTQPTPDDGNNDANNDTSTPVRKRKVAVRRLTTQSLRSSANTQQLPQSGADDNGSDISLSASEGDEVSETDDDNQQPADTTIINTTTTTTTTTATTTTTTKQANQTHGAGRRGKKRLFVSKNEKYRSQIYSRSIYERDVHHPITGQMKLSQKYWITKCNEVENQKLDHMQRIQENYEGRHDKCQVLRAALQAKLDNDPELKGKHLGKVIRLLSDYRGGKAYMQHKFKDAIAICNRHGKPTLFVTFTGNPAWTEITEYLRHGESWIDRPDLVVRVFNLKAKEFLQDVLKRGALGKVKAYSMSLEHQKRGMPHLHMLLTMEENYKYDTAKKVDDLISAKLPPYPEDENDLSPKAETARRYYNMVMKFMVHEPSRCASVCGPSRDPNSNPDVCGKGYPKAWSEVTVMRDDGYAQVKRPNDGVIRSKRVYNRQVNLTNQYVVPHNKFLLMKYNCHINVEHCGGIRAIKYLFKYINKGHDRAFVSIRQRFGNTAANANADPNSIDYNEIYQHRNLRVKGACESVTRILGLLVTKQSHVVEELPVHLEKEHDVTFHADNTEAEIVELCKNDGTDQDKPAVSKLTAFFKLVQQERADVTIDNDDPTYSMNLYYHQIPEWYTWKNNVWVRRNKEWKVIGRLRSVYPSDKPCYCLRELLKVTKGPCSFESLRTVDGVLFKTYQEAAVELGLYFGDELSFRTMEEVTQTSMPRECRIVFALILAFDKPSNAKLMWEKFKDHLLDRNTGKSRGVLERRALAHIASILWHHQEQKTTQFNLPEVSEDDLAEAMYDLCPDLNDDGSEDYKLLDPDQKLFVDKGIWAVTHPEDTTRERLFFLQGSGGTGKTFVYNCLIKMVRDLNRKVIAVASTGIAAILLHGGQTAHSAFKMPIDINQKPNLSSLSAHARIIREADLIIWDEAPMQHKKVLENVQLLIKDLFKGNADKHMSLFGNKTVILGGDFKQLLPVVKHEAPRSAYDASLLSSDLFLKNFKIYTLTKNIRAAEDPDYATWLSDIGHGAIPSTFGPNKVQLPDEIVSYDEDFVIEFVYPASLFTTNTSDFIYEHTTERLLMAPHRQKVQQTNDKIVARIPGAYQEYRSINVLAEGQYPEDEFIRPTYDPEQLALFEDSSIPPNILRLKEGTVVMLTRNIDIPSGMCNGTRLFVVGMRPRHILCRVMTGISRGMLKPIVIRPNLYADENDDTWPSFTRYQLPLRVAFAITINKAQGQTLCKVGVLLSSSCFAHGQLYVALSRVRSRNDIKVFVDKANTGILPNIMIPHATNIVFPEVIHAIKELSTAAYQLSISATIPPPS